MIKTSIDLEEIISNEIVEDNLDNNLNENDEYSSDDYDYMDDEMRNLYFNNSKDIDYTIQTSTEIKKKQIKEKNNNHFTLLEFNKKTDKEQKDKEPKKFMSKRMNDKKKQNDNEEILPKRKFNPRLPPFNFVNKPKIIQTLNMDDFPSL